MLGFNDTSTIVGHFVSSPREREKKKIEVIVEEMNEIDRENLACKSLRIHRPFIQDYNH